MRTLLSHFRESAEPYIWEGMIIFADRMLVIR